MENQVSFDGLDFSPEINLSRYLQNIKQFPILSQEEEYNLAKEYVTEPATPKYPIGWLPRTSGWW